MLESRWQSFEKNIWNLYTDKGMNGTHVIFCVVASTNQNGSEIIVVLFFGKKYGDSIKMKHLVRCLNSLFVRFWH